MRRAPSSQRITLSWSSTTIRTDTIISIMSTQMTFQAFIYLFVGYASLITFAFYYLRTPILKNKEKEKY